MTRKRFACGFSAAVLTLCLANAAPAATAVRPQDTSAVKGQPNISGIWVANEFVFSGRPSAERRMKTMEGEAPPLQPWAQTLYDKRAADADAGVAFADAASRCLPNGVPLTMYDANYGMQIIQSPGQVTLLHEEPGDFRIIYLDAPHPADLDVSFMGHSVGRFEGDTLVVDTVGLIEESTIDKMGLPHTDKLHVVERIRRLKPDLLEVIFTLDDPGAYTRPWRIRRTYHPLPAGDRIREYVCSQNQRNSPDAQGNSNFGR